MQSIQTLITHAHLFTMQGKGVGYIEDGAVAIDGQRIVATGSTDDLCKRFQAKETIDATDCAVLPGFVDAHIHTTLSIIRGVAQDVTNWMQTALAPYTRYITPQASLAGCRLNSLEALKMGTTTFCDNGGMFPGWPEVYDDLGVRARLAPMINGIPTGGMAGWKLGDVYPLDSSVAQAKLDAAVSFGKQWHGAGDGRITVMLGAHAPDFLLSEDLMAVKHIAEREGWMIHMHVAQGDREIDQMVKRYGQRTPDYLREIGYLDKQLLAVHLTEATDAETEMIARSGASMALCSSSIGIIDGIVPPAYPFRQAGGLVALGTDQAPGNNSNNMFDEMKLTALFNKIKYRDPTKVQSWDVLRMATIEGAQAVGLGDEVGSLEVGKQADLIMVDLTAPNLSPVMTHPVRNIVPNLVYAATGAEVSAVMVAGEILVQDGKVLGVDEKAIRNEAQVQAERIQAQVAGDLTHKRMVLLDAMEQGLL